MNPQMRKHVVISSPSSSSCSLAIPSIVFKQTQLLLPVFISMVATTLAGTTRTLNFTSCNLYPESLAWDPNSHRFILGSLFHRKLVSVSESGTTETVISDPSLPAGSAVLGVTVDTRNQRLLAAVHSPPPFPSFNAIAAYDLRSGGRLFLARLPETSSNSTVANDVTVDDRGNAYVTNSAGNFIWRVTGEGEASILSRSPLFTSYPVDRNASYDYCGINGVAYLPEGYLLVVQTNTGVLFKVNVRDGTARTVILNKKLVAADGIAVRSGGARLVVVSQYSLYFIRSDDGWEHGDVYDEIGLDVKGFATSVAAGNGDRVYVLYGHVAEGIMGKMGRNDFRIVEVESEEEERKGSGVRMAYGLMGLGIVCLLLRRFQMRCLIARMNKKTR